MRTAGYMPSILVKLGVYNAYGPVSGSAGGFSRRVQHASHSYQMPLLPNTVITFCNRRLHFQDKFSYPQRTSNFLYLCSIRFSHVPFYGFPAYGCSRTCFKTDWDSRM